MIIYLLIFLRIAVVYLLRLNIILTIAWLTANSNNRHPKRSGLNRLPIILFSCVSIVA
jgi:hypothetical protein